MRQTKIFLRRALLSFCLAAMAIFVALPAAAQSVDEAKSSCYAGETPSGYLGVADSSAPTWVAPLVADTNAKRTEKYAEIAQKNGTSVEAVAAVAGKKLVEGSASGQCVQDDNGSWVRVP